MSTETGSKPPSTTKLPESGIPDQGVKHILAPAKIARLRTGRIKPVTFSLTSGTSSFQPQPLFAPLPLPPLGTVVDWAEITECFAVFNPTVEKQAGVIVAARGYVRDHYLDVKLEASWVENSCLDDAGMPCGALVVEVVEFVVDTAMDVTREFSTALAVASPAGFRLQEDYVVFCGWEPGTLATPPPRKTMRRIRITL